MHQDGIEGPLLKLPENSRRADPGWPHTVLPRAWMSAKETVHDSIKNLRAATVPDNMDKQDMRGLAPEYGIQEITKNQIPSMHLRAFRHMQACVNELGARTCGLIYLQLRTEFQVSSKECNTSNSLGACLLRRSKHMMCMHLDAYVCVYAGIVRLLTT